MPPHKQPQNASKRPLTPPQQRRLLASQEEIRQTRTHAQLLAQHERLDEALRRWLKEPLDKEAPQS
jgi:hypothetical protein